MIYTSIPSAVSYSSNTAYTPLGVFGFFYPSGGCGIPTTAFVNVVTLPLVSLPVILYPTISCSDENTKVTWVYSHEGTSPEGRYEFKLENLLLFSETAVEVAANYPGDTYFNQASDTEDFKTVETTLDISKAYKTGTDSLNITAALSWDKTKADGKTPGKIIEIKVGAGTCNLDISSKTLSCDSENVSVALNENENALDLIISGMHLDDTNADNVSMEYKGDGFFESSSNKKSFETIPTDLVISKASKRAPGFISLTAVLSWVDEPTDSKTPSGTIIFTSGTGTCTLDISAETPKFTDCNGKAD